MQKPDNRKSVKPIPPPLNQRFRRGIFGEKLNGKGTHRQSHIPPRDVFHGASFRFGVMLCLALFFALLLPTQPAEAISISQEKKLAQEFMASIKKQGKLIDDPIAVDLISRIGQAIVSELPPQPFNYTFYIVDEAQFNAFAGPGANIFVNRGLVTSLDTVHELAGILGHEVAHAACRHISEMVDQSKMLNFGTMAGLLAGILVGATSGEGGASLGQAVAIGSMAAGQTLGLSYSREHEAEADQKGLGFIQASHFDPKGLLTGLEKIRNRDYYGTEGIPDYMKTHPGTTERIVNIQSWLDRQQEQNANALPSIAAPPLLPVDPFEFKMVQARLSGIYGNEDEMEMHFAAILRADGSPPMVEETKETNRSERPNPPGTQDPQAESLASCAAHYGMALVLERKNRLNEALDHLRQALMAKAFDPMILVEVGRLNLLAGNPQKALEVTQGLEQTPTISLQATFILSEARLMLGLPQEAMEGFERVTEKAPTRFPKAYYHMARINGEAQSRMPEQSKKKKEAASLSHYYLGLYYYYSKNMKNARFHLEKSLETLSDREKSERAAALLTTMEKKKADNGHLQYHSNTSEACG